jgi:hypothetical protein
MHQVKINFASIAIQLIILMVMGLGLPLKGFAQTTENYLVKQLATEFLTARNQMLMAKKVLQPLKFHRFTNRPQP